MTPKTIQELQDYCAQRSMPLAKMRFFIGVNYTGERAFGIYQDGDRYIVYKNKSDGSRAVRYDGPDEAYAVGQLFDKLLDECHKRGIDPENQGQTRQGGRPGARSRVKSVRNVLTIAFVVIYLAVMGYNLVSSWLGHRKDGYYRTQASDDLYYRYGDDWYTYNNGWYAVSDLAYDLSDAYLGDSYASDWGGSDFTQTDIWEDLHESDSSDSSADYDSWDSFDTDWDSDW